MSAKPFVKWVGGKRQLLSDLSVHIPSAARFYEPFLGGGAVFFGLCERFERAVLNDANRDLINAYREVQTNPSELMQALDVIRAAPDWNTQDGYEALRRQCPDEPTARAARLIALNRLTYNGLYRVNRAGQFNAPFGRYENPRLYDREAFMACAELLAAKAELRCGDYLEALTDVRAGDVVYFDPPYVPVSATSSFTAYIGEFGEDKQRELAAEFDRLVSIGVYCVLSNSDAPLVRELYSAHIQHVVAASRSVNSAPDRRGVVPELIVVGRPVSWADRSVDLFSWMDG